MSKNNQRNLSEINLGNQTYERGYADGLHGRPVSIKKTHRHVHRYHAGYRHGGEAINQACKGPLPEIQVPQDNGVVQVLHTERSLKPGKQGLFSRIGRWLRS